MYYLSQKLCISFKKNSEVEMMRSTSSTQVNLLASPMNASNQSKDGPSTSGHLVGQEQKPQMVVDQSDFRPLNPRPGTMGELDNNTGLLMPSLPVRYVLTAEEIKCKIDEYSAKIKEYTHNMTNIGKGKQKVPIFKHQKKISSYHEWRVLDKMLHIKQCHAEGYVYGMVRR
jgi:hypothetical protein